jgi:hypothetical protein
MNRKHFCLQETQKTQCYILCWNSKHTKEKNTQLCEIKEFKAQLETGTGRPGKGKRKNGYKDQSFMITPKTGRFAQLGYVSIQNILYTSPKKRE